MAVIKRWRHYPAPDTSKRSSLASPHVMSDIAEFTAHAARDPEIISSRSTLKEYEKKYECKRCGGDLKPGQIIAEDIAEKQDLEARAKGVTGEWE